MTTWTIKTVDAAIRKAKKDECDVWLTEARPRGEGRLRLRARPGGHVLFYFRYSCEGTQHQLDLGTYDESGRAGLTLGAARASAGELSRLYQSGVRNLHSHLAHERAAQRALIEAAAAKRREDEKQATAGSLQALLKGYTQHLERQGKMSAKEVGNLFKLHVFEAHPQLTAKRASEVVQQDVSATLAGLINQGKGRTAAKLRSYLSAAFTAGLQAEGDPTIHPSLHGFALKMNPAALVPAKSLRQFNRERERALNEDELRVFLKALDERPGLATDAIRLTLYLGGQRLAQLLRLKPAQFDPDGPAVTLLDPKGKRLQPRLHVLPLTDPALAIVERLMQANADHKYLISSRGKVPVRVETLSKRVHEISTAMVKAKKARAPFQMCDLRRTCETMLARMGVSRDTRAQLLSHGLSGVQQKHYDRYDYMPEKQRTLKAWARKLDAIAKGEAPGKVVPLRRG
ncbi:tyrosine-type recombinase/integrase [Polaromonas sp. JS666]|uniref:tyrosine-type recombinase/integrase n=1 Tax=Polaromonas sp. (strain JS666 / ATCC BAA-500) TaxID=296591 RepID=UPI0000464964|nr:integrase family protein [Polaromonas sp. JS666]ABE43268.1 phage integrase [Polaromonas sp. JS666]